MYQIIYYTTERGDSPVENFLETLDRKVFTKVAAFIGYLAEKGTNLHRPYSDHVKGAIRELRISFAHNEMRVLYFFQFKEQVVLLHGFLKKDQQLKKSDIELAERRMFEWLHRYK